MSIFNIRALLRNLGAGRVRDWAEKRVNYTKTITVHKSKIRIPHTRGVSCSYTEPWMLEVLSHLLKNQLGAFVDVGVNLGQTLIKVKSLEPNREYYGFEPNPSCVEYSNELIVQNSFPLCTIIPAGIYTHDKILVLEGYSSDPSDSSASIIPRFRDPKSVQFRKLVPVYKFDTISENAITERIGIIKIDVEGAELEVLESMRARIEKDRPIIVIEILPAYSADNKPRLDRQLRIEQLFREIGYRFLRIGKHSSSNPGKIQLVHLSNLGIYSDLELSDYVVVPEESPIFQNSVQTI